MNDRANNNGEFQSQFKKSDDAFEQLLRFVITESHKRATTDKTDLVAQALLLFLGRVSNTWLSIRTLQANSPDENGFAVDASTLIRAMYDAYLQAEYLAADKKEAPKRAQDYFDFEHVERYKWREKALEHDNLLTNGVKSSPKFDEAAKTQQEAYARVKDRFLAKKANGKAQEKQRTRNHWYPGNLRDIAENESVGKSDEYDTVLHAFQGCVHSSVGALSGSTPIRAENVMVLASRIAGRVARLNVDHNQIELCNLHARILDLCRTDFLFLKNSSSDQ